MRSRMLAVAGAVLVAVCGLTSTPAQAAPVKGQDTGLFFAISPVRAWDTRVNGSTAPLGPGATLKVKVTGVGGVPASGVAAVTMNLTVTAPSARSHLTVYPSGSARPNASSINFQQGDVRANTITMRVGTDGSILVYNSSGTTHVVVDLTGFYASNNTIASTYGTGAGLIPVGARLVDSRSSGTPIAPGATRIVTYRPASSTPPTERALYLNITVPSPSSAGWLRVWSGVGSPNVSTVNFAPGTTAVANTTAIGLSTAADRSQSFAITNGATTPVHFIVDVLGTYDSDVWDTRYVSFGPTRVMDTRTGVGVPKGKLPSWTNRVINLPASLKSSATYAIIGNAVLVGAPMDGSWIRIWDNDPPPPGISTVNADTGETIANGTVTGTNYSTGNVAIYNTRGPVDAILDVTGYFAFEPASASATRTRLLQKSQEARAAVATAAAAQAR